MRCLCPWSIAIKSPVLFVLGCMGILSAVAFAAQNQAAPEQAAPPQSPPVSEYASPEALMNRVDYYVERIGKSLDMDRYSLATQSRVSKDASVLIVLFMSLGLHDEDSPLQSSAPRLVELSEELVAASEEQAPAKAAYEKLLATMKEGGEGAEAGKPLAWEKRAQLGLLMKQVTAVNSLLKRYTRSEALLARAKEDVAGQAALLAAIGQAALVDTHEVKEPEMLDEWYKYASEMRDAAGAVGQAIDEDDFAAVQANMQRLQENCDGCHEAFRLDPISAVHVY